ncbi:MAG: hypothetical protein ACJ8FY_23370 [Gemmataceae bacterium]
MATFVNITEPVGFGFSSLAGHRKVQNITSEVSTIQDMLGQISADDGGTPGLSVTGKIIGPNDPTILAIRRFQKKQFGFEDGVVDPGAKTERRLHEVLGSDNPPPPPVLPDGVTFDTVVRIMGQDPKSVFAGKPTAEGESLAFIPDAVGFSAAVETPEYKAENLRLVLINFFGGGGRANPASDPTQTILDLILAQQQAAQTPGSVKIGFRRMIVFGTSIGGRNCATLARRLVNEKIHIDYLGLIDAAFDDENDPERRAPVVADQADNFLQAVSNDLRGEFPEFEFHGLVPGCQNTKMEDTNNFYRTRKKRFDDERHFNRKKDASNCFDDLHAKAVQDAHQIAQRKVLQLLRPD